ncbi:MAG: DNA processing protein DprA, partial [Actinomycetota bacterium]|nr:DNA processing protein DprA [Actinomycetota bacterium]
PGPVTSPLSSAPHRLLQECATLVQGPEDVLVGLGVRLAPEGRDDPAAALPGLSDPERRVVRCVAGAAMTSEAVAVEAGVPLDTALGALAALEMRGLVRCVGGRYERTALRRP